MGRGGTARGGRRRPGAARGRAERGASPPALAPRPARPRGGGHGGGGRGEAAGGFPRWGGERPLQPASAGRARDAGAPGRAGEEGWPCRGSEPAPRAAPFRSSGHSGTPGPSSPLAAGLRENRGRSERFQAGRGTPGCTPRGPGRGASHGTGHPSGWRLYSSGDKRPLGLSQVGRRRPWRGAAPVLRCWRYSCYQHLPTQRAFSPKKPQPSDSWSRKRNNICIEWAATGSTAMTVQTSQPHCLN